MRVYRKVVLGGGVAEEASRGVPICLKFPHVLVAIC